ncbi:unnamed protein product [Prorocentrum cordatum]|uniref:Uncharacterized protein n=1 Tax=Prorocentrum cordatum TaxID=2364126 RepID=A0ABN9QKI6_9DINO|nr:unnamed protein product [Polarella glacialis]
MFRMGLCEDAKEVAARICEWDDQLNARVSAPTGMPQNVERIISSKSSVLRSDDHAFMNHLTLQWLRAAARCWVDGERSLHERLAPDCSKTCPCEVRSVSQLDLFCPGSADGMRRQQNPPRSNAAAGERCRGRAACKDVSYCWPLPTMSSLPRRISAPTRGGLQPRISRDPMERPAGDRPTGC